MNIELKRPFILAAVMLGMFLSAVEATIVATAMPSIVAELENFSMYSWVFSAYLLSSSATVLIFGKLADIYGRRPIYVIGVIVFLIGSTTAGFSTSMFMLIIARFIQGVGAGALMPIATTIVGDIYTKTERAKIQGYLSAVWGISAIVGPLIGAFFVDLLSWRYVFWMNIPLGLLSMLGIIIFLKEDIKKRKRPIDIIGTFLIVSIISIIMYVLVEGGISVRWFSLQMFTYVGVVFICFTLFIIHSKRAIDPIIPLHIWSYRIILVANIASLLTGMILMSVSSYLPTFVQGVMGKSAIVAGFTLTTMSIGWPIASAIAGRLLLKIGYRKTSLIGGCSLIIGTIFFIFLPVVQHYIWAGLGSFFIGIGMGVTSTSFIVAIQSSVNWEVRGTATASNMFMRSIGGAVGVAFLGGILNNQINREIESAQLEQTVSIDMVDKLLSESELIHLPPKTIEVLQDGLLSGLEVVYIGITLIALISFILLFFMPKDNLVRYVHIGG